MKVSTAVMHACCNGGDAYRELSTDVSVVGCTTSRVPDLGVRDSRVGKVPVVPCTESSVWCASSVEHGITVGESLS